MESSDPAATHTIDCTRPSVPACLTPRLPTADTASSDPTLHPTSSPVTREESTTEAKTSHSVPTLRFPRPLGDRRLTNWISSSSPDIMRGGNQAQDQPQLADSITDGYEFVGTDGEDQTESIASSYEHHTPDLGDDVQSLADTTDIGTDADTNDVTDSSDDEYGGVTQSGSLAHHARRNTILGDSDATVLANRSLELPTDVFSHHTESGSSVLDQTMLDARRNQDAVHGRPRSLSVQKSEDAQLGNGKTRTLLEFYNQAVDILGQFRLRHREGVTRALIVLVTLLVTLPATQYLHRPTSSVGTQVSTVPVVTMTSVVTSTPKELSTSSVSVATTLAANAIQTTSTTKALTQVEPATPRPAHKLYSVELLRQNQVSFKVATHHKSMWQAKRSVSISVFREQRALRAGFFKVSPVDDGFIISIPHSEAYGVLDFSVNTTRKPRIDEMYRIQLGSYSLINAVGGGKDMVQSLARVLVDTVNGTTHWVEGNYLGVVGAVTKHVTDKTVSVQELLEAGKDLWARAKNITAPVMGMLDHGIPTELIQGRLAQVKAELRRQTLDMRDEVSTKVLTAQLQAKLLWLKVQGKKEDYSRYLAAAGPYLEARHVEARKSRAIRAAQTLKYIRSFRKQDRQGARTSFWKARAGSAEEDV